MRLVAMTLPDEPAEQPGWLDRQLIGLDLAALVAELTAVHGGGAGPSLDEVLGSQRQAVLNGGLVALPRSALMQLLGHPQLLLEVQELVLTEGGPHWQRLCRADTGLAALVERGEQALGATLTHEAGSVAGRPFRLRPAWYCRPWLVSLATAATMLLIVYFFREPLARQVVGPPSTVASAWGWEKLAEPRPGTSPSAYLNELADAADEWFRQRPEVPSALARRIGEMRQGCSRLILAKDTPLANAEQTWLVMKCREWAEKFDKALTDLEGGRPAGEVRQEMDQTVTKLVAALRDRAERVKAG
jgi:hypothetical protein